MPRCCCWRFILSTFGWCCCCCTVPISNEKLPLLDHERIPPRNTHESCPVPVHQITVPASYTASKRTTPTQRHLRIVTTSDTHMKHSTLSMPPGDILIVAGDFTCWKTTHDNCGTVLRWLSEQTQYRHKVVIAGNHEVGIDETNPSETAAMFKREADTVYLQDSGFEAFGVKLYGSPWHPKRGCLFRAEAFAKSTKQLEAVFARIPSDTDVLISHAPPYGVMDAETAGHVGSASLLRNCKQRVKPIMHVFGHVHRRNGIGRIKNSDTLFVNTATKVNVFDLTFQGVLDFQDRQKVGVELVVDGGGAQCMVEEEQPNKH